MINICQSSFRRSIPIMSAALLRFGCIKKNISIASVRKFNTIHRKIVNQPFVVIQNGQQIIRPISTSYRCSCIPMSERELKQGAQIYDGQITKRVRFVKFFSISTSLCSLAIFPTLLLNDDTGGFGILGLVAGSVASVMFFTPLFLHYFTKRYVTRMYLNYDTDIYTAYTINFILQDVKHVFHQKDILVPSVANIFTTFKANGRSFMVDVESFSNPNDYAHLMGYDKMPITIQDISDEINDKEK
ncbi:transmembrane protein 70, mitochondrial-like [Antedon mediterranea]|uniref:transmembrane protein 70, mitochondrial-like n=1 Tax=Antedon mediterranea TaxID=105859 RepID=UPI003AF7DFCE